ncbi:MAG: hypothetical protein H7Y15_14900, partial [Pseudonocardia sp.]|nr:hypothetical protein [Pseudonocardia sp.]
MNPAPLDTSLDTAPFRYRWSVSAARSARECPTQWSMARARTPRVPATLDQRR